MLEEDLGYPNPRNFQVDVIFNLAVRKVALTHLIRKTGEGKSLCLVGMAAALRGVTIALGPLHGLGTDQAAKSKNIEKGMESYHVDEFRESDYDALVKRLRAFQPQHNHSVIIYISPQSLREKQSKWHVVLRELAIKGHLSAFCVDEVHTAVEYSDSFRPEFRDAIEALNALVKLSKKHHPNHKIPVLTMSATFPIHEQKSFQELIGRQANLVCWGEMDKRTISITCRVAGDPLNSLTNDLVDARRSFSVHC